MANELLEAALCYESIGWSVIPVRPDKKPYISWRDYQKVRATQEQIKLWWREYKDAQIGIVTGQISNIVVVDLDAAEGITSFDKLDDGQPTVCSKTGSGGCHYFYAMPKEEDEAKLLRNFARRMGIDLRANGGYVVVPPSQNQKGQYEWRISPDNQNPSDCPVWVIDACKVGQTFRPIESIGGCGKQEQTFLSVLPSLENGVDKGSRNDSAARLAGHFFRQGKTKTEVSAELVEWNAKNRPPLELSELEGVVESIGRTRAYKAGTNDCNAGAHACKAEAKSDVLCALSEGERGDAKLFVKLYRDRFCYDSSEGTWYEWKGHVWAPDRIREARASVEGVIQIYKDELHRQSHTDNETKTKDLTRRITQLSTRRRADECLELSASGANSLAIEGHEWDVDPYLLACPNGVIDLRTGELRQGRQREYIKTVCPTEFKGTDIGCPKKGTDAPCPAWEEFLFQIFDEDQELISYVKRLLGYSMLGLSTQHEFYIFWGQGRNGKGTLFQVLSDVLGPYVSQAPKEMLLYNRFRPAASSPRSELMALRGKRLVWASESDEGRHLDTSQVKWLSGGDSLVAREVYGKHQVEFRPTFTLFLQTNHKPKANAYDYALWERIRLIPFNLSFVDDPQRDHESVRDPNLAEKLKQASFIPGI